METYRKIIGYLQFISFFWATYSVTSYFINNPFESYTLPIIIIWIPDVFGWTTLFVLIGLFAGFVCVGVLEFLKFKKEE